MKWDWVVERLCDVTAADAGLVAIFGSNMRYAGSKKYSTPILEHQFIGDSESELWNPILMQWDIWTLNASDMTAAERRLRILFHQELPIPIGGMMMWCQFEDGEMLSSPDRDNVFGRAVRFRFTPLRSLYDPVPSDS